MSNSNYSWENQLATNANPPTASGGVNEFAYLSQQQQPNSHFPSIYVTQANSTLTGLTGLQTTLAGQFNFTQPPPAKPSTSFHVPPPTISDFQQGPLPLMSIPPIAPQGGNHLSMSVNLFPPPRDLPPPRLPFNDSKTHELQFQVSDLKHCKIILVVSIISLYFDKNSCNIFYFWEKLLLYYFIFFGKYFL